MKSLVILVCLFLTCKGTFNLEVKDINSDETNLVVGAIQNVFTEYFAEKCPKVDVLICGAPGGMAETMANDLLPKLPESVLVQITNKCQLTEHLSTSTLLLFDSIQLFKRLKDWSKKFVDNRGIFHKHLLYAPGLKARDVIRKFGDDPTISGINFIINYNGHFIELATSFLFTPETCHKNQIRTINRYTRRTQRWDNSNFYPNKYDWFHGCTLRIGYDEYTVNYPDENILKEFSEQMKFKFKRIAVPRELQVKDFHTNNTDMSAFVYRYLDESTTLTSSAIAFNDLVFVAPPGEPLTDLERMFAAFDFATWVGIGITFGIALVTIVVIKFTSRKIQNFVFGRGVTTPTLNVFSIFLTGGQHRSPGRNFARFMLMMFILWSLIFRTCYQSKTFEHLNSDLRHPRVKTYEELKQQNFNLTLDIHFFGGASLFYDIDVQEVLLDGMTQRWGDIPYYWYDIVPEPANKFTYINLRHYFYNLSVPRQGRKLIPSFYILEKNIMTYPYFMLFSRYTPYSETFKEKIDPMLASGMIQKWHEEIYAKAPEFFVDTAEPQVLTWESLKLGFYAYLIALAFSFIIFLLEVVVGNRKRAKKWFFSSLAKCSSKVHNFAQSRT